MMTLCGELNSVAILRYLLLQAPLLREQCFLRSMGYHCQCLSRGSMSLHGVLLSMSLHGIPAWGTTVNVSPWDTCMGYHCQCLSMGYHCQCLSMGYHCQCLSMGYHCQCLSMGYHCQCLSFSPCKCCMHGSSYIALSSEAPLSSIFALPLNPAPRRRP